jgi:hypothetical protein
LPEGLDLPVNEKGCQIVPGVISNNTKDRVTWIHFYVSADKKKNGLPVDKITEVKVLEIYFYN